MSSSQQKKQFAVQPCPPPCGAGAAALGLSTGCAATSQPQSVKGDDGLSKIHAPQIGTVGAGLCSSKECPPAASPTLHDALADCEDEDAVLAILADLDTEAEFLQQSAKK